MGTREGGGGGRPMNVICPILNREMPGLDIPFTKRHCHVSSLFYEIPVPLSHVIFRVYIFFPFHYTTRCHMSSLRKAHVSTSSFSVLPPPPSPCVQTVCCVVSLSIYRYQHTVGQWVRRNTGAYIYIHILAAFDS